MQQTTTKQDLTEYESSELSNWFQNDESLYNAWNRAISRNDFTIVNELADEYFTYSEEQLDELREDFDREVTEAETGII